MRIYFDTEFLENGKTIELISIGLTDEDGRTLYMETEQAAALADSDPWLCENVKPHLRGGAYVHKREQMAAYVQIFCGEKPEFWAWYADYDWVALCQLYGRMINLPDGWPMYCRDLKQVVDMFQLPKPPKQDTGEHDALADALWLRDTYGWAEQQLRGNMFKLKPHVD